MFPLRNKYSLGLFCICLILLGACKKDVSLEGMLSESGFPSDIDKIMRKSCATSGCHNSISKDAAAGINLETWEDLFKGGRNNACVIPYRADQSVLFFGINKDENLGPTLSPTMPYNQPALPAADVLKIRDWINAGAPDKNGRIAFSENSSARKKVYVANQGCDLISVIDVETQLVMRAYDVGKTSNIEAVHDLMVSPDNKNWYITYYASNIFQKFDAATDELVGEINLGEIGWHSMAISGDSRYAIMVTWAGSGGIVLVDLLNFVIVKKYMGAFFLPHGCALNHDGTLGYAVCFQGNFLYKIDLTNKMAPEIYEIPLQTGETPAINNVYKPYEVEFSPDYSRYYVTCQGTFDLRVFNSANDNLLAAIPMSGIPQTIAFSTKSNYAFVTNMNDKSLPSTQSMVDVINYQTNNFVKAVYTGPQPRGLAVDNSKNVVYVANRNVDPDGPAPHHSTNCIGRNGFMTLIDIQTLELIKGYKAELSVDPYTVSIKN